MNPFYHPWCHHAFIPKRSHGHMKPPMKFQLTWENPTSHGNSPCFRNHMFPRGKSWENHMDISEVRDLKLYLHGSATKPVGPPQRGALFEAAVRQGLQGLQGRDAAPAAVVTAFGEADPVLAAELMKPRRSGDGIFLLVNHQEWGQSWWINGEYMVNKWIIKG